MDRLGTDIQEAARGSFRCRVLFDVGKTHKDKFLHPRRETGIDDVFSVNCIRQTEKPFRVWAEEDARDVNEAVNTRQCLAATLGWRGRREQSLHWCLRTY